MLESEFVDCIVGQVKAKHSSVSDEEIRRAINDINEGLEKDHIRPSVDLFVKRLDDLYKGR